MYDILEFKKLNPMDQQIVKNLCKDYMDKGLEHQHVVLEVFKEVEKLPWFSLQWNTVDSVAARVRYKINDGEK